MQIGYSVRGVPIRLTAERWMHVIEARDELAGRMPDVLATVENPDWVTQGYAGAFVAWKSFGRKRYMAVVYRETSKHDGFVVTAFLTSKPKKRKRIWP